MQKRYCILSVLLVLLCACSGLEVAMENKDVSVLSSLDNVPFLDAQPGQKVYVKIQNFSEYPELGQLSSIVGQKYQQRGFVLTHSPDEADWIIEAKIVNIKKEDYSAREIKGGSSSESAITGAGVGGTAGFLSGGDLRSGLVGALIGGVLSGAADLTVNSWVKLGYLTIVTDIQVRERTQAVETEITSTQKIGNVEEKVKGNIESNWMKYRFQALTRAKKANLKWEDCKDKMVEEISRILASLL